jgi:DNA recombination protein RmuC
MTSLTHSSTQQLERIRDVLDSKLTLLLTQDRDQNAALERSMKEHQGLLSHQLKGLAADQRNHFESVSGTLNEQLRAHREDLGKVQANVETKLQDIRQSNEKQLDKMRETVDEKLQSTLEQRLGESFKQVSQQLESVQRGLGEMQTLAADVGNLNRVLSNVKARGILGETQLKAILEQILTAEQYVSDYRPKEGRETVEFAVRLPGGSGHGDNPVFLPIDAKFPKEDYERLVDASEQGDKVATESVRRDLLNRIERFAKDIEEKYINPPCTTTFAVMFLPTEGLYAEALREPGFHDRLQQRYRVIITGPTTLSALLNSLRMGFQTLAIEQRSAQVWEVLGAVRTEFSKFGGVLDKVKKQLGTAAKSLDEASVRTRVMEKKLRTVEAVPSAEATQILELDEELPMQNGTEGELSDDESSYSSALD